MRYGLSEKQVGGTLVLLEKSLLDYYLWNSGKGSGDVISWQEAQLDQ